MQWKIRNVIATIIFILITASCQDIMDTPDDKAIAIFEANKQQFLNLIDIINEDYQHYEKSPDSNDQPWLEIIIKGKVNNGKVYDYKVDLRTARRTIISLNRLKEYVVLTNSIGLKETFIQRSPSGEITIVYTRFGIVTAGTLRKYVYKPDTPTPLYESLDIPLSEPYPTETWRQGYRKINDDWYLFVSYN